MRSRIRSRFFTLKEWWHKLESVLRSCTCTLLITSRAWLYHMQMQGILLDKGLTWLGCRKPQQQRRSHQLELQLEWKIRLALERAQSKVVHLCPGPLHLDWPWSSAKCGECCAQSQSGDKLHTDGEFYSLVLPQSQWHWCLPSVSWGLGKQGSVFGTVVQQSKVKM